MAPPIMATGSKIGSKVTESISGKMAELTPVNGKITTCMVRAFTHGLMNASIVVIGTWENSMASAPTLSKRKTN